MTSTGTGKAPNLLTSLLSSAITTMRFAEAATIFSRSSAPPPPLIKARSESDSSAPSTARSSSPNASNSASGMLSSRDFAAVRSDVGVPMIFSPPRIRSASSSRNRSAVEPVPSPSFIPSSTKSSARAAAARFRAMGSGVVMREQKGESSLPTIPRFRRYAPPSPTRGKGRRMHGPSRLFHRDGFGQVARLVHVGAFGDGCMIGEHLYRQRIQERRDERIGIRHLDGLPGAVGRGIESFPIRDEDHLAAARHDFLHIRDRLLEQFVMRRDHDDGHIAVDERDGTVLHLARGIAFGVDV